MKGVIFGVMFWTLLAAVISEPEDPVKGKIKILKCCHYREELVKESENEIPRCVSTTNMWTPFIYSPKKRSVLSQIPNEWEVQEARKPKCADSQVLTFLPYSAYNPFILMDTGEAVLESGSGRHLNPEEYCADANALLVCVVKTNDSQRAASTMRPSIRRCCGPNAAYDENRRTCIESPEDENAPPLLPNISSSIEIKSGFPPCPKSSNFTIAGDVMDATLEPDGSLLLRKGQHLSPEKFCVEKIKETKHVVKIFACLEEDLTQKTAISKNDIRFTLYPLGFIVSAIFLAATLAAGWLLPASHHVLHWRCQTHHVACLMVGDLFMAIIQLAGDSLEGELCKALAIMAHFSFLAAFFWLNTMCFNIWWTFRDLRPASLEKGQETLRLRVYAAYAWGGPLLVAGLAAVLDHLPANPTSTFLRPRFGEKRCWFYGDMEILAYFFGPVGVLLAINLLFFAATARELTCGLWKGEFVKSTTERAALGRVCMKLVVVMGVTWVLDVISWAVGGPEYVWYVTDVINAFQGVFIFIVVGCQPQVRAALKRICNRNPRTNAGRQGNGLSTTSHGMPSMGDSVTQNPSTKTAPLETIC
ncbi:probable G-protein coupled receptor Mth-like 1 isoform X2 [Belonocnema kinseyi]|uniref:probable G-protein coupled receptor Mth-like 1 isoform X2 n=1 Tax=Belonocnema kinseyi TaxID=2817044 RepID=UPI00143D9C20|nr:probable G-protein coupled receptor Mth-like 1 isoform X2 [Belonocnema kinseyi]